MVSDSGPLRCARDARRGRLRLSLFILSIWSPWHGTRIALHPRFHLSGTTSPTISFTPSTGTPIMRRSRWVLAMVMTRRLRWTSLIRVATLPPLPLRTSPPTWRLSRHPRSLLPRGVRWLRSAWREILLQIEEPGGSSESSGLGGDVMRSDFTPFPAPHIPYQPESPLLPPPPLLPSGCVGVAVRRSGGRGDRSYGRGPGRAHTGRG